MKPYQGFTLIEILVVLVLTSLIAGILLEGLQQIYSLERRFGSEIYRNQQESMRVDWFRTSIQGLMPDYSDGKNQFKGEARWMAGQTIAAFDKPDGALVPTRWFIDVDTQTGQTTLFAGSLASKEAILSWEGSEGRFVYFDNAGERQESWPPLLKKGPQIPSAIILEMGGSESRCVVALPRGPITPWPKRSELYQG